MLFDVRTAMLMSACITAMLALCLLLTLRRHRAPIRQAGLIWVQGTALQPLAWIAFSLRDYIPDLFSVLVANLLICLAYAEYPRALRLLHGNAQPWYLPRWIALAVLLPVCFYTWIVPSVPMRAVTTSLVVLTLLAMAARETVHAAPRPWPTSHRITLAAFSTGALLLLVRAVFELLSDHPLTSGVAATPMQGITFGYMALAPAIATFGFVLMCSEHTLAELEKLAATDPLTGVLNRRTLEQLATSQLASARRHRRPLCVLLLDADRFKQINDLHGHGVGDEVLKSVVAVARQQLRPEDLIGRLGGEEFLVLLSDTRVDEASEIAERLRAAIAALDLQVRGQPLTLSVSIGVTELDHRNDDFHELVRRADRAMYLAKRGGRNRVVTGEVEAV